ncbi:response regulator transcription factor [Herpetosiphon sp. NSE202]|uniref:response regulator transcription factor n=1 Tax=Herpetosiphon sp. NSE202 TaxID=3351349 RepID=UPI003631CCD1
MRDYLQITMCAEHGFAATLWLALLSDIFHIQYHLIDDLQHIPTQTDILFIFNKPSTAFLKIKQYRIYSINDWDLNALLNELLAKYSYFCKFDYQTIKEFTKREYSIFMEICAGLSNRMIAEKFQLSERTVEGFVARILQKTGLKNRHEIIVFYYKFIYPINRIIKRDDFIETYPIL